jgi:RNA polymerase sigma-70 factor (ECF subfamily)
VVALNRAVAVANVHGPRAGIEAVAAIKNRDQLKSYYLLYTILGEFEALLNNPKAAINYFRKSLELATIKSEKKFLSKRLRSIEVTLGSEL